LSNSANSDVSKRGELHVLLARRLFEIAEGERVPNVRKLAAMTRTSVGSVSSALRYLQDIGAIQVNTRGRLGTILAKRSLGVLWSVVEQNPFVFAMSLPMHRRFEGLATGLKLALGRIGLEAYPIFIRGSRMRLEALMENRCDVAIMSDLAAEELLGPDQEIVLRLPPGSWVSHYYVYYRVDVPESVHTPRVAIDPTSFDHSRLVELEFAGQEIERVWASYMQFPRLLKNGDVDAIVWTADQDELYLGPGIQRRPLSDKVAELVADKARSAAFVARAHRGTVSTVIRAAIQVEDLMGIQDKVVEGAMLPKY